MIEMLPKAVDDADVFRFSALVYPDGRLATSGAPSFERNSGIFIDPILILRNSHLNVWADLTIDPPSNSFIISVIFGDT